MSSTTKTLPLHVNAATGGLAITPDDANDLSKEVNGLYVGGAGNVKVDLHDGSTVTLNSVLAGTIYPMLIKRVYATGTTATNLVGLVW